MNALTHCKEFLLKWLNDISLLIRVTSLASVLGTPMARVGHALTRSFSGARLQPQSSGGGKFGTPSPASNAVRFRQIILVSSPHSHLNSFLDVASPTLRREPNSDDLQVFFPWEIFLHCTDGPRVRASKRDHGRPRVALRNIEERRAWKRLIYTADPIQVRSSNFKPDHIFI